MTRAASRIPAIFSDLRARGAKGLMPFVCASHPAPGAAASLLPALERAGASVVEIGFPFSDPIADGPVIAAAMHDALAQGATPASALDEVRNYRKAHPDSRLGLVAMVSVSIVERLGAASFIQSAKDAGIDGFIFPDVPLEESGDLIRLCAEHATTASLLISPSTPPHRAERIAQSCTGFVYLLARAGITGEGRDIPDISARVQMLRTMTDLPIACGFGVSTAAHVRQVVHDGGADAAIVGSALVRVLSEAAASQRDVTAAAVSMVQDLARGLA